MSCPHCGAADDTDRSAEQQGLVYKAEAARRCQRSTTWIGHRIAEGSLETATFAGRVYVTASSLHELLHAQGPATAQFEIDRCLAAGEFERAQALHDATNGMAILSRAYRGMVDTSVSKSKTSELPDPVDRFIARSKGGN